MDKNGIYKAMGEFDIFINYIEKYLTMRRKNWEHPWVCILHTKSSFKNHFRLQELILRYLKVQVKSYNNFQLNIVFKSWFF